jgi:transcriptional regulator with XRE-family HTH domain
MEELLPITKSVITAGDRLKLLRQIMGLTRQELGRLIKYSSTNIQYWEENQSPLSKKGCDRIIPLMQALGLQCNASWLLQGVGAWPQFIDALKNPENVNRGEWEESEEKHIFEEINLFYQLPNTITLNVLDDGMQPHYLRGDTVGGSKYTLETQFEKIENTNCIVETADGTLLFRQLKKDSNPGRYALYPLSMNVNNQPLFDQKLMYVAPVTRLWRRSYKI